VKKTRMNRFRNVLAIAALAVASAAAPAAVAAWDGGAFVQAQSQKGRPGGDRGAERDRGREARPERHEDRRDRMTEDDRRSLHRDLDKANRELYGRRFQK
jgi:Ni/Co efflux regulator RcnB